MAGSRYDGDRSRVAAACRACVRDTRVDGGGVVMLSSRQTRVLLHATDRVARAVEDLQFAMGVGPSFDAASSGLPVLVPDTSVCTPQTDRWPGLAPELAALEVGAVFAFPVRAGSVALGTLDLYRRSPGDLSGDEIQVGLESGTVIAEELLRPSTPMEVPNARLRSGGYPMSVHRAAGMVMVQLDTTIDDALSRLRAAAYREGVEVSAVAIEILDGVRRFDGKQS
ncbi:GAF and ANTAR domain-containing protein [Nocardioides sp. Iso805N]|uniref:GAF and ANTAR domain-containing protein n=1 Tax=Nocardioides sp. Iso805N TaxID=1283287 RepID=UPI00039CC297